MNAIAWYKVPELWLVLALLAGSIVGSLLMARAAIVNVDRPITTAPAQAH